MISSPLRNAAVTALALSALSAHAQLFSEDFDADHSANWTVNVSAGTDTVADFNFDYSSVGIASAPRSGGGTTRGLKLQANLSAGVFGGLSVSPTGEAFFGDYVLSFDMWMNYNGPAPVGGSGSTQAGGAGILTAGSAAQWAGSGLANDSLFFAVTTDGNSSADYRVYSPDAATSYADGSGVYAAGTSGSPRNHSNAYYSGFGNLSAPAAQTALYPQQTGNTLIGSQAFAWHQVDIFFEGGVATWFIDGLLIATVDTTAFSNPTGGNNVLFTHFDTNATSSTDPNDAALLFSLYDNITVSALDRRPAVPEPGTYGMLGAIALAGLAFHRRRRGQCRA